MNLSLENWLSDLHNLSYFERRLEIARGVRPRQSRFIYKYKSIDPEEEESVNRVRDILINSRLWLSSPVDFNDPFDMSAKTVVKGTPHELHERYKSLLKQHGARHEEIERRVRALASMPIGELNRLFAKTYSKSIEKFGVYSFTDDPRSILMWSHYAQDHTGICIQFERARDYLTLSRAISVDYSSDYPEVNWANNFPESLRKAILRKHEGWSYEKESRIVRPEEARQYLEFDPQAIVGIIIGCRTTPDGRKAIETLLEERHCAKMPPVKLFLAKEHGSKYQLSVVRELKS